MINPFLLEGKKILVTGSSSGIGRGIAIECSKIGAKIILNGRNLQRLEETLALLDASDSRRLSENDYCQNQTSPI